MNEMTKYSKVKREHSLALISAVRVKVVVASNKVALDVVAGGGLSHW
jgi:hypothetical protein